MKKKSLIIILLLMVLLTGCTKQLTKPDENNKKRPVINEKTGQTLTENILCQPSEENVIKLYKENNVDIDKLPKCSEFNVTSGGYEGIWSTIFIKPLAFVIVKVGLLVKNYGLAIIIIGILIRLLLVPITKKTAVQSENMKKAQPDIDKLELKYRGMTSQEDQMKKSQEIMGIYKKYNISPLSGCIFAIIQLPLLIAFLEAVNRVPAIFENSFLTLQLGTSPLVGLGQGNYLYLILVLLIGLTTYYSFKLNATAPSQNESMGKQMKYMNIFMIIFITISSLSFPAAISLYWIATSLFTIGQNLWVKRQKHAK